MRQQVEKLMNIEKELSQSQGPFDLFALLLREDSIGKWDLVVSSVWANKNKFESMQLITDKLKSVFTDKEMLMLSRLVILDKDEEAFNALYASIPMKQGLSEISDMNVLGQPIKHGYLIH
jgi:hypothetical protein